MDASTSSLPSPNAPSTSSSPLTVSDSVLSTTARSSSPNWEVFPSCESALRRSSRALRSLSFSCFIVTTVTFWSHLLLCLLPWLRALCQASTLQLSTPPAALGVDWATVPRLRRPLERCCHASHQRSRDGSSCAKKNSVPFLMVAAAPVSSLRVDASRPTWSLPQMCRLLQLRQELSRRVRADTLTAAVTRIRADMTRAIDHRTSAQQHRNSNA